VAFVIFTCLLQAKLVVRGTANDGASALVELVVGVLAQDRKVAAYVAVVIDDVVARAQASEKVVRNFGSVGDGDRVVAVSAVVAERAADAASHSCGVRAATQMESHAAPNR
jgi:hypothetical protein